MAELTLGTITAKHAEPQDQIMLEKLHLKIGGVDQRIISDN